MAHRWPNWHATCHCWANVGPLAKMTLAHRWLPTVAQWRGQRWPTGQNDIGPPVAANGGPTAEPPGSCYLGGNIRTTSLRESNARSPKASITIDVSRSTTPRDDKSIHCCVYYIVNGGSHDVVIVRVGLQGTVVIRGIHDVTGASQSI